MSHASLARGGPLNGMGCGRFKELHLGLSKGVKVMWDRLWRAWEAFASVAILTSGGCSKINLSMRSRLSKDKVYQSRAVSKNAFLIRKPAWRNSTQRHGATLPVPSGSSRRQ